MINRVSPNQFDLYMKVDTNTNGHRQWFYFSMRNNKKGTVKLNIFRFKKRYSLFQRGMRPYTRSLKSKGEWKPAGFNVSYRYEKNNMDILNKEPKTYYLTFQYKFEHSQDEVFFSSGIPYTYTFLQKRLDEFNLLSKHSNYFSDKALELKIQQSAKTLCGLKLPLLTIEPATPQPKKYIIVNGRTHSGQSSASWVMDGLIEKILTSREVQQWMLNNEISIKILPMLNPDGVFLGNYRTGIVGDDFNRKFISGKKEIFPEIHYLKQIVSGCKKNGEVFLFLDLHGHSILRNSFLYGPVQSQFTSNPLRNLPTTLWHASRFFQLSSCKFNFQKDLAETARVYFQLKQNILTYTSETSLGLYNKCGKPAQMLQTDYKTLGGTFVQSMATLLTRTRLEKFSIPSIMTQNNVRQLTGQLEKNTRKINTQKQKNKRKTTTLFSRPIIRKDTEASTQQILRNSKQSEHKKSNTDNENSVKIPRLSNATVYEGPHDIPKAQKKFSISDLKSQSIRRINNKISRSICARENLRKDSESTCRQQKSPMKKRHSRIEKIQKNLEKLGTKQQIESKEDETQGEAGNKTANQEKRSVQSKSTNRSTAKFKIRKRNELIKLLPESFRKKIGSKPYMPEKSTKHFDNSQTTFSFERSATYDSAYLSSQLRQLCEDQLRGSNKKLEEIENDEPNLEIIDEQNFSQDYDSINDSDSSSENLEPKKKQYLLECIRSNPRQMTNAQELSQTEDASNFEVNNSLSKNINRFKQIEFKSLQPGNKNQSPTHANRVFKRDPNKFRDTTHKSLNRNLYEQSQSPMMVHMIQKKQLNERASKKSQREPYHLIQIKNKFS